MNDISHDHLKTIIMSFGHLDMNKVNAYTRVNDLDRHNYPNSMLPSAIAMNQLWICNEIPQVEVIELNSNNSEGHSSHEGDKFAHGWNDMNGNNAALNESEDIFTKYKDKQTKRSQNTQTMRSYDDLDNEVEDVVTDFVSSIYGTSTFPYKYIAKNDHSNFFTVINKYFDNSDSSPDDIGIQCTDAQDYSWDSNNRIHNTDRLSLDENNSKKRTIRIYSIKNKRLLSKENTLELENDESHNSTSSTSNSFENYCEDPNGDAKELIRVGSPVPAAYIPRLNLLSPRLPTVTEITEPCKTVCEETRRFKNRLGSNKRMNGWFEGEDNTRNCISSEEKSDNTSMSSHIFVSSNERRSRFKHSNPTISVPESKTIDMTRKEKTNYEKIKTDAEINGILHDNEVNETNSLKFEVIDKNKVLLCGINNDNGPVCVKKYANRRIPKIKIPKKTPRNIKNISNPIERLDNDNWIIEENNDMMFDGNKESKIMTIENTVPSQNIKVACPENHAGNRLWARNASLLKPAEWQEYRAIANSIPSLQLSIDTESKTLTWFYRFITCFKCCK